MSTHSKLRLIRRALQIKHVNDALFFEVKTGPTQGFEHLRLDAISVAKSWTRPHITGYEIKVDRSDFKNDIKWPNYLPYCHAFYFVTLPGIIVPEEVPDPAGLIIVGGKGCRAVKKAIVRPITVSSDLLYYLVIAQLDGDRFPEEQERDHDAMLEYLEGKCQRSDLSRHMRTAMSTKQKQLISREEAVVNKEEAVERTNRAVEIIRRYFNIDVSSTYFSEYRLEQQLRGTIANRAIEDVIAQLQHVQTVTASQVRNLQRISEPEVVKTNDEQQVLPVPEVP